ncbi:MAG TPA: aromatic acid exporter family protein [Solirubrobacteraceae bacterium]|nr:aromatic acid exporter family protein [Solirubrobacteraceae bacterium]
MGSLAARLRDPLVWTDTLQLVKTAAAAVIAWVLAKEVFGLPQPFLAPWAALLTVHATVYRTMTRGVQQAAAAVIGVVLAFAVSSGLGSSWLALLLVLLAGLAVGRVRPLRAESTTAAATALVVLLTGYSDDGSMLLSRLGDTFIGIGVGLAINFVVWPPLRDRSAARRIDVLDDRLGELLSDMASTLCEDDDPDPEPWVDQTRELDSGIDDAWTDVRHARESGRLNMRRHAARRVAHTHDLGDVLVRLAQAVADTRSMARTIGRAGPLSEWEAGFRDAWITALASAADAVRDAHPEDVQRIYDDLESVADSASSHAESALAVNLRNVLEAMAPVAAAQPVRGG